MDLSRPLTGALQGLERDGIHLDMLKILPSALAIARRIDELLIAAVLGNVLAFASRPILVSPGN